MSLDAAPIRVVAMLGSIVAGTLAGAAIGGWVAALAGAAAGYVVAHTTGWALDRFRPRPAGTGRAAGTAQRYRMRTTTLSGSVLAGLGFGLIWLVTLALAFGLITSVVVRRLALTAPALFALAILVVTVGGVFWLRRAVLSDVEVVLGAETLVLTARRRRASPAQELRLAIAEITCVTRFVDPFGAARWLRVDAGALGRFELRSSGLLAGRRAQAAIDLLGADLVRRIGPVSRSRPYVARWGTTVYRIRHTAR